MRLHRLTLLCPVLLCSALTMPVTVAAPGSRIVDNRDSASQVYLQGHLLMQEGAEKEKAGEYAAAYFKFRDARTLFDAVNQSDKSWNPEIVEYRRRGIREDMERVRQLEIKRRAAGGAISPDGVVGPADPADADPAKGGAGMPLPPRNTQAVADERLKYLQAQIDALTKRNEDVLKQLGGREEELRATRRDLLDARTSENILRESLAKAETKLQTADISEKRKNEALTKRVAELEASLKSATDQLSTANGKAEAMLGELEKAYAEIKDRTRERDELAQERDELRALLAADTKNLDKLKIVQDSDRMKKELEEAKTAVAKLKEEKEIDTKTISTLRGQMEEMQNQLAEFKAMAEDYRQQITTLTSRLDEANRRLYETAQGGISQPEAQKENEVLREIILQQMKQQAKRERARQNLMDELGKEGVLERMKELGVENETMLRSINEMAAPVAMTREQRGVLSSTRLDQFLLKNGVGELMAVQDSADLKSEGTGSAPMAADPASLPPATGAYDKNGLSPELKAYANAAEQYFREGSLEEAENQFQKILLVERQNVYALCNAGVVQLRRGRYNEAEMSLKKALAYNYDSDAAHYVLGVVFLRQGQINDAEEEIQIGLKINPNNAEARHTLGLLALKARRMADAESEFKQAIAIDPTLANAHLNLAVIYVTAGKDQLARQHYRLALKNGADRNEDLDKFFGGAVWNDN